MLFESKYFMRGSVNFSKLLLTIDIRIEDQMWKTVEKPEKNSFF